MGKSADDLGKRAAVREASTELKAFLVTSRQFIRVDLYTFTLVGGTVLRYCAAQRSVTVGGHTYNTTGLKFERGNLSSKIGLEVDEFDFTVLADPTDTTATVNGVPFAEFALMGGFDGAYALYERLIMPTWGDVSLGTVPMFYGTVSEVKPGRSKTEFAVKSLINLLNVKMPRDLYQPGCRYTLYDHGCTLNKADFAVTGYVLNSTGSTTVFQTNATQADDYFSLGMILFSSGANNGVKRTVKGYTMANGQFTLALPLPSAPSSSDTFVAHPGCDKLQATCETKFDNLPNFGGFPYIPVAETAR